MIKKTEDYKNRAKTIKALAHPTRLFIIDFLSEGEKCVCEIVEQVNVDISTISKHLLLMKKAGIVEDKKKGLNVFYKLKCTCIPDFLDCLKDINK